ncbi:MAG: choice-of-anchor tandem repeat GloVer-containing protein [Candidatus Korobacteraceae bacterium]|jgi:uncharacterized repeat protein (TIGR03803 family)
MPNQKQQTASLPDINFRAQIIALVLVVVVTTIAAPAARAQTFSVLHNFHGGGDGEFPTAGVILGSSGVLYGTTSQGGNDGNGTVFKLSEVNSGWFLSSLIEFAGTDGDHAIGGVVIGPNGALYGTTEYGGPNDGTVFELRPPATSCKSVLCSWNDTILHSFTGQPTDGEYPENENLTFDQAGNIYGTTSMGGMYNAGTTFELTPSGGGYTESILYNFQTQDGLFPYSGVVFDKAGNLYGTTKYGRPGTECPERCGTVYQLMPSSGGWVENVLLNFDEANGAYPFGNLIIDGFGNLYGITAGGGPNDNGVVFKLAPSDGGWTYSLLYSLLYSSASCSYPSGLTMDAAGNFFGVCYGGGAYRAGWIFELTNCSNTCMATDLHDFSGSDGQGPIGSPVLDTSGNLYGTTLYGGTGCDSGGCGVVWEITP